MDSLINRIIELETDFKEIKIELSEIIDTELINRYIRKLDDNLDFTMMTYKGLKRMWEKYECKSYTGKKVIDTYLSLLCRFLIDLNFIINEPLCKYHRTEHMVDKSHLEDYIDYNKNIMQELYHDVNDFVRFKNILLTAYDFKIELDRYEYNNKILLDLEEGE